MSSFLWTNQSLLCGTWYSFVLLKKELWSQRRSCRSLCHRWRMTPHPPLFPILPGLSLATAETLWLDAWRYRSYFPFPVLLFFFLRTLSYIIYCVFYRNSLGYIYRFLGLCMCFNAAVEAQRRGPYTAVRLPVSPNFPWFYSWNVNEGPFVLECFPTPLSWWRCWSC